MSEAPGCQKMRCLNSVEAGYPRAAVTKGEKTGHSDSTPLNGKPFLALLIVSCFALMGLAFLLWWVPYVGLQNIHPSLPLILAICLGSVVTFGLGGALTLIFTILWGKNLFINRKVRGVVIRFLFPLLVVLGKLFGMSKDEVRRSFISVNNRLVLAEARKVRPEKLLVLLPHCLQFHECAVRITGDIENCKACGKCKIKDLVAISRKYRVSISVATGGTLARRIVVETRPEMIIGVACERDLTSGIQDTYPIPVYGILNRRPFGPCFDTDVDLSLVEDGILSFLKNENHEPKGSGPRSTQEL